MKLLSIMLFLASGALGAEEPAALVFAKTIALPGVKGRFDHFAIDTKAHRLFIAALGNNTLEIIDLAAAKHLKSLAGLHKPTGVLYLADQNQIAVANGDDGTLKIFDADSFNLLKSLSSLDDADNLRFDAKAKRIYLGYGDGALAVIDPATMKQTANVKLAAHPESFQLEANGLRVFVNIPDAKQVAVFDRQKRAVTATWPMTEFKANFPMALDEPNHRLFVGCRQPARLVVFDTLSGKPTANLAISGDTDDLFYDAKRQRLYISCGEGFLDVIACDRLQRVAQIATRAGARTSFFSHELDALYLAVPQRDGRDAEIRIYQPQ